MAFQHPEFFWLMLFIPALVIISVLLGIKRKKDREFFAQPELFDTLTRSLHIHKKRVRSVLFMIGLFFLILAGTEPRWGTKTEIIRRRGTDIVIAIDTSFSMLAEDVKPSRIKQARYEIRRLIDTLQGDRIALVAFAGRSFVQCPLTSDYAAAKTLLEYIDVGIIPEPGTDLGEAIHGSIALLERGSEGPGESQVIILFTDGEDLADNLKDGIEKAQDKGVRIFTVGVGTRSGELIPIRNDNGVVETYKKNREGTIVKTSLDDGTLTKIATETQGSYLRTENGEVDIQAIIDMLGLMQKSDIHERKISRLKERYQVPLGISLAFLLTWLAMSERRRGFDYAKLRGTP
ncbi:VWA domain-containing protein [Candidatus Latescibacterota bacterium]